MTVKELLERLVELAEVKADVARNVTEADAHVREVAARYKEIITQLAMLCTYPRSSDTVRSTSEAGERHWVLMALGTGEQNMVAAQQRAAVAREKQASVAAMQVQALLALAFGCDALTAGNMRHLYAVQG